MPANKRLLILPGDGIGPEVMREVRRIIDWMSRRRMVSFDIAEDLVGGASIDARGTPITEDTMRKAKQADAILFGSVGGPKWEKLGFQLRPELAMVVQPLSGEYAARRSFLESVPFAAGYGVEIGLLLDAHSRYVRVPLPRRNV